MKTQKLSKRDKLIYRRPVKAQMATVVPENSLESNSYDKMLLALAAQDTPVLPYPAIVLAPQSTALKSPNFLKQLRFDLKPNPNLRSDSWRSTPQSPEDSGSETPLFSSPSSSPDAASTSLSVDDLCDAEVARICSNIRF